MPHWVLQHVLTSLDALQGLGLGLCCSLGCAYTACCLSASLHTLQGFCACPARVSVLTQQLALRPEVYQFCIVVLDDVQDCSVQNGLLHDGFSILCPMCSVIFCLTFSSLVLMSSVIFCLIFCSHVPHVQCGLLPDLLPARWST